jgi:hypothetical protein
MQLVGEENADSVTENRFYFNKTMRAAGRAVQYAERAQQRVKNETDLGFTHFRGESKVGHTKKIVKFDFNSSITGKEIVTDNAVLAHRRNGTWTFYFSSYSVFNFLLIDERKLKGWSYRTSAEKFSCVAITSHGAIWPQEDITDVTLIPQVYKDASRVLKGSYA